MSIKQADIILCGPETHFDKPLLQLAAAGWQLPTKPLVRTAVWLTADMIMPVIPSTAENKF